MTARAGRAINGDNPGKTKKQAQTGQAGVRRHDQEAHRTRLGQENQERVDEAHMIANEQDRPLGGHVFLAKDPHPVKGVSRQPAKLAHQEIWPPQRQAKDDQDEQSGKSQAKGERIDVAGEVPQDGEAAMCGLKFGQKKSPTRWERSAGRDAEGGV